MKNNNRLPRKQKKIFVAVLGVNEYQYQRLLMNDPGFKFMAWKKFEKVTKEQYKKHLKIFNKW